MGEGWISAGGTAVPSRWRCRPEERACEGTGRTPQAGWREFTGAPTLSWRAIERVGPDAYGAKLHGLGLGPATPVR